MRFKDKVALVTGGGSGFGAGIAQRFVEEGAKVLVNDIIAEGGAVTEEAKNAFLATIPLGRFSTPLDVANACVYLASDEASMISGSCIEVDGARCV